MLSRLLFSGIALTAFALSASAQEDEASAELIAKQNRVDYIKPGRAEVPAAAGLKLYLNDRLITRAQSRATVMLSTLRKIQLDEETELTLEEQSAKSRVPLLDLIAGAFYYFSRDKEKELEIRTRHVSGGARGTEFLVRSEPDRTLVVVFDGSVELESPAMTLTVESGFQGEAAPDGSIALTPILEGENLVQWWLFYPAVIDVEELNLTPAVRDALSGSLEAYRRGDIVAALELYPPDREPASDEETVYLAGLLLAAGRADRAVEQAEPAAERVPAGRAIRTLADAARGNPGELKAPPSTAAEWLANSYHWQARHDLRKARSAAEEALRRSPTFSFAMVRLAELDFSFGRTPERELTRALQRAPRNAQALAMRGFVRAEQGAYAEAMEDFERAIEINGALGNAWLGRGLLNIRSGRTSAGVSDLQTAAALERNRALLRSYLGKGLAMLGDLDRAKLELDLARQFDPNDPTAWLYSALLHRDRYEINPAVEDLERSLRLNEERRVYRSRQLLDRDRAVRGSNLASIYQSAGMTDLSLREATRAVSADYANFSAHLFLANSYHALRDPTRFNLRYETVWFNELLLANLLAPVGVGTLSQNISFQEYSSLFERNPQFKLDSVSQYRSDGQFQQYATHQGTYGRFGYSLDLDYRSHSGVRPNNDLDRIEWYSQFKYELPPNDSLFLLTKYQDFESGDNFQYRDPASASRTFRFEERQDPLAWAAWQRSWREDVQSRTLVSAGRLESDSHFYEGDRLPSALVGVDFFTGAPVYRGSLAGEGDVSNQFEIYVVEAQHLFESDRHRWTLGWRGQGGRFRFKHDFSSPTERFLDARLDRWQSEDFLRSVNYLYYTYKPLPTLHLTGGLAFDVLEYPGNLRHPPFDEGEGGERRERLLPKAAAVFTPNERVSVQAMYAQSMGGVSFDESFRLEPAQLAGFPQAFRTLVSESLVGSIEAPLYELAGLGLDFKLPRRLYLGLSWSHAESEFNRGIGYYLQADPLVASVYEPAFTREDLAYEEQLLQLDLVKLLGGQWSLGCLYRLQFSELENRYRSAALQQSASLDLNGSSRLHRIAGFGLWNHPSGWFAKAELDHYRQESHGFDDETLTQVNAHWGRRMRRNRIELSLGVLNLTDNDYRLSPLNAYAELPRERVFMGRLRFSF